MRNHLTVKEAMQMLNISDLNYHDLLAIARLRQKGVISLAGIVTSQSQRTFLLDVNSLRNWLAQNSLN